MALYDAARYAEARTVMEQLDQRGEVDGPLLYRLFYCQRVANDPAATETLRRAIERLERESAESADLEAPFYLANAYANVNRREDMLRVAQAATRRLEAGSLPEPTAGIEQFRVGKLYADQGRTAEAERWYAAAVGSFGEEGSQGAAAYLRWAARYLAEASAQRDDLGEAERYYTVMLEASEPTMADLDRLAVIRGRLGLYAEAARAWRQAERVNPAEANRARYGYRLMEAAAALENLSAVAPDGRLWTQLTKQELESIMQAQAAEVRAVKQEAEQNPPGDDEQRKQLQSRLDAARPVFFGAALEYVLQGHSIREAAFFGGYAPLIFKAKQWQIQPR